MVLDKTIDMMLSEDYKERFKAEYHQTVYRRNRLQKLLREHTKNPKKVKLDCSIDLLTWQLKIMDQYIYVLKRRAEVEKIKL